MFWENFDVVSIDTIENDIEKINETVTEHTIRNQIYKVCKINEPSIIEDFNYELLNDSIDNCLINLKYIKDNVIESINSYNVTDFIEDIAYKF